MLFMAEDGFADRLSGILYSFGLGLELRAFNLKSGDVFRGYDRFCSWGIDNPFPLILKRPPPPPPR